MNKNNNLILAIFSTLLFFSCETEGQITGNTITPDQDKYVEDSLSGDGVVLARVENVYYDLLGSDFLRASITSLKFLKTSSI